MRLIFTVAALAALSACSPSIPDSAAGVGFNDYDTYEAEKAERDAAVAGSSAVPPSGALSDESIETTAGTAGSDASEYTDLAAETRAALAASRRNSGEMPLEAAPSNPPPETVETVTGISAENDFEAVEDARSIESDAELIAHNREQYQVVQPKALPARSGDTGPNIVDYALSTKHPVGTRIYTRIGINKEARFRRNCAKYASPDRAQIDFLENGGPNRDRMGLDPDGDGYACGWNPAPFRKAVHG